MIHSGPWVRFPPCRMPRQVSRSHLQSGGAEVSKRNTVSSGKWRFLKVRKKESEPTRRCV